MQVDEEVDEDFEKELAALMTDFKLPPSGPFPQASASLEPADTAEGPDAGSTVSFRVMMKRGGRDDRSKAVQVCLACACCPPTPLDNMPSPRDDVLTGRHLDWLWMWYCGLDGLPALKMHDHCHVISKDEYSGSL